MCLLKHMEESTVSSVARSCACVTVGETHVNCIRKIISGGAGKRETVLTEQIERGRNGTI